MGNSMNRRKALEQSSVIRKGLNLFDATNSLLEDTPDVEYITDPNAIIPQSDGRMVYKNFEMSATGLYIPPNTDGDEWTDIGNVLKRLETSISWVIGDWALYAKNTWDMTAAEIAQNFEYETSTIETYMSVCDAISGMIRNQDVSFSHHRLVAKLPPNEQSKWLKLAAENKWTVTQMKAAMVDKPKALPAPPPNKVEAFQYKLFDLREEIRKSKDFERQQMIVLLESMLDELRG